MGDIAEEVSHAIEGRNRSMGEPRPLIVVLHLKTVVRGELLDKAKKLGTRSLALGIN